MRRAPFVLLLIAAGCFSGYSPDASSPKEWRVRRGRLVREITLTGEVEAARGVMIAVPPLPSWQTSIKWIAEDGTRVRAGDRVVELDNSQFTSGLDAKQQAVAQADQELQQKDAEAQADLLQKKLDVDSKQADYEKTKLDAAIPKDIVAARDYEDRQIKFQRATVELKKAEDVLRSQIAADKADRANLLLDLEKAKRDLATAQDAISALTLRAPRDGIVVLKDHPWEGRKLKEGDPVFVGWGLALLPELSSLRITAALADVDDGKIADGMPATVILDAYPSMTYSGRIDSISAVAQENTTNRQSLRRSFRVAVKLDRLDPARMRPGLSARVIVRRDAVDDALLVPRAALESLAKKKDVRIGECNDLDCVVLAGLKEGERL